MNRAHEVNDLLKMSCVEKGFMYIDNSFIDKGDMRDRVHLNDFGKRKLVNNYIRMLNIWWDINVTVQEEENGEEETTDENIILEKNDITSFSNTGAIIRKIQYLHIII